MSANNDDALRNYEVHLNGKRIAVIQAYTQRSATHKAKQKHGEHVMVYRGADSLSLSETPA